MPPVCRQARVYSCSSRTSRPLLVSVSAWVELVGGGPDQREHQRVGVPAPAGQVDHADRLAGHGIAHRHPGAGHALEPLRVVLVPEHVRRAARFERGPDAVGADDVLGVAEAGHQHDGVELALQVVVAGEAAQHEPGRVGQDDADRLTVELLVQVPAAPARRRGPAWCRGRARPGSSGRDGSAATFHSRDRHQEARIGSLHRRPVDGLRGEEPVPGLGERVPLPGSPRPARPVRLASLVSSQGAASLMHVPCRLPPARPSRRTPHPARTIVLVNLHVAQNISPPVFALSQLEMPDAMPPASARAHGTAHGPSEETYNPWSIVNLVFRHLADEGLHPVLGESGDPGKPAAELLRTLGITPAAEGNRQVADRRQRRARSPPSSLRGGATTADT